MGPRTTLLCEQLRETCQLLKDHSSPDWAEFIETVLWRLERSDLSGIDLFLRAYGGMGSFNDLALQPADVEWGSPMHRAMNDRLDLLRSSMSELAHEIRHEAVVIESPTKKA